MDLVGIIAAEADPPGLDEQRWREVMREQPGLEYEADGVALLVVDGETLGRLSWSTSGAREIDVHGELDAVKDVAYDVAHALGGRFVTLQELTSC